MNEVQLRHFSSQTLLQVSNLINKRTLKIRMNPPESRTPIEKAELENLLTFQTHVEYARILVSNEEKVANQ